LNTPSILEYSGYSNGVLTLNPMKDGRVIENICFISSYKTRSAEDGHTRGNIFEDATPGEKGGDGSWGPGGGVDGATGAPGVSGDQGKDGIEHI
jgi:hypothetical protein